eukprot:1465124-Rhodomonas_salina.1
MPMYLWERVQFRVDCRRVLSEPRHDSAPQGCTVTMRERPETSGQHIHTEFNAVNGGLQAGLPWGERADQLLVFRLCLITGWTR